MTPRSPQRQMSTGGPLEVSAPRAEEWRRAGSIDTFTDNRVREATVSRMRRGLINGVPTTDSARWKEQEMFTRFERRHSNGVNTWVRKWPVGWEYGVGDADGSGATTILRHQVTLEAAQAAADGLAHQACDERCGEWVSSAGA